MAGFADTPVLAPGDEVRVWPGGCEHRALRGQVGELVRLLPGAALVLFAEVGRTAAIDLSCCELADAAVIRG